MNLPLQTLMSWNILILAHYIQGPNNYLTLMEGRTWCLTLLTWRVGAWPFRINIKVQIIAKTCKLFKAVYPMNFLGPQQILETKCFTAHSSSKTWSHFPHRTHKVTSPRTSLFLLVTPILFIGSHMVMFNTIPSIDKARLVLLSSTKFGGLMSLHSACLSSLHTPEYLGHFNTCLSNN